MVGCLQVRRERGREGGGKETCSDMTRFRAYFSCLPPSFPPFLAPSFPGDGNWPWSICNDGITMTYTRRSLSFPPSLLPRRRQPALVHLQRRDHHDPRPSLQHAPHPSRATRRGVQGTPFRPSLPPSLRRVRQFDIHHPSILTLPLSLPPSLPP